MPVVVSSKKSSAGLPPVPLSLTSHVPLSSSQSPSSTSSGEKGFVIPILMPCAELTRSSALCRYRTIGVTVCAAAIRIDKRFSALPANQNSYSASRSSTKPTGERGLSATQWGSEAWARPVVNNQIRRR